MDSDVDDVCAVAHRRASPGSCSADEKVVVVVPKDRQGEVLRDAQAELRKSEHRARIAKALRDNGFVD